MRVSTKGKDYNYICRGVIYNNVDEDYNRRRCQIRIPHLHGSPDQKDGNILDKDLPWAENSFGDRKHLENGSRVYVMFENGDVNKPVIVGVVNEERSNKVVAQEGYYSGKKFEGNRNMLKDKLHHMRDYSYYDRKGRARYVEKSDGNECITEQDSFGNSFRIISPSSDGNKAIGKFALVLKSSAKSILSICEDKSRTILSMVSRKFNSIGLQVHGKDEELIIAKNGNSQIAMFKDKIILRVGDSAIEIKENSIRTLTDDITTQAKNSITTQTNIMKDFSSSSYNMYTNNYGVNSSSSYKIESNNIDTVSVNFTLGSTNFTNNGARAVFNSRVDMVSPTSAPSISSKPSPTLQTIEAPKDLIIDEFQDNNGGKEW